MKPQDKPPSLFVHRSHYIIPPSQPINIHLHFTVPALEPIRIQCSHEGMEKPRWASEDAHRNWSRQELVQRITKILRAWGVAIHFLPPIQLLLPCWWWWQQLSPRPWEDSISGPMSKFYLPDGGHDVWGKVHVCLQTTTPNMSPSELSDKYINIASVMVVLLPCYDCWLLL
ncbi:hypothetical protein Hamer_G016160 [Homarus americanus]|uniref:Uncharacterized protein n=1 Tax=Homarus americanus TaxID=6706 RepID=A0A8J5N0D3_HOMAM|nr:hypothetical protein Hamer_G016160 [Homarus americanus]